MNAINKYIINDDTNFQLDKFITFDPKIFLTVSFSTRIMFEFIHETWCYYIKDLNLAAGHNDEVEKDLDKNHKVPALRVCALF